MLGWIVSSALKLRWVVLTAASALIVWGIRTAGDTPLDVFPEFAVPTVEVQTEAPGLSSEEVERLVTMPLENLLNGAPRLVTVRSKSVLGLSSVVCLFEEGTDLLLARQIVQERLAPAAEALPRVAGAPVILQPLSSLSRVLLIGMWSGSLSRLELSDLARWTVRPRLMRIRGVANVSIWGERERQLQVLVDPDTLRVHGLTLAEVERAAAAAADLSTGGFIDTPAQRLAVTQVAALATPADLARAVVAFRDGAPLHLGEVSVVVEGHPPPIGEAVVHGADSGRTPGAGSGLLLVVEKQPWGNTLEVTREIEEAFEELRPGLSGVEIDPTIFRPATFIERAIVNLEQALLLGSALVIAVLAVFLFDWRTALISSVAVPLSLLGAAVVLHALGATVNTMILAGLVIAVGEVVDDAIIDVENIARRLRLDRASERPRAAFEVVLAASLEVRSAVVYATFVVVCVFLPVLGLQGVAGAFFRPLAFAYVLAVLASLAVALTVTPALSLLLLGAGRPRRGRVEASASPPVARTLQRWYRRLLPRFLGRPRAIAAAVAGLFAVAVAAGSRLPEQFFPEFHETDFLMHWVAKPGTSLEAMERITQRVSHELLSIPGVRNFGAHIGRAERGDEIYGPNFAELWISIEDSADYERTVARIREVVAGYPGLIRDVLTYLTERIEEVLTGASAAIVVRIFGPDFETLNAKAREALAAIANIDGVADAHVEEQQLVPRIDVKLRPDAASRFGLTAADVRRVAETLLKGRRVGQVHLDQRTIDVAVWGAEHVRRDLAALRALPIDAPAGAQVPLGDLAEIAVVPTPNAIRREGASRRIDLTCNVAKGHDLGKVAREIEERVRGLPFDRGYHPEFLGLYAARTETRNRLLALAALAVAGLLVILHVDFQSLRLTLLVALSLPFALIGGVAGAAFGGGLSLGALVGFVTVLGIAARNGILLVSHFRHLEVVEGVHFGRELVLRGAQERLSPILMTALTTAFALVPLAVRGDAPGHEIEYPMALVILGGLVTSTVLNLFVLPALYLAFGRAESGR